MRKLLIGIIILLLLVPSVASVSINKTTQSKNGNILYVGGSGEGNYTKIQDAIDDAVNGDIVYVYNGTYYEVIKIDKSINLIGEDKNNTIINSGVTFYYTVYIFAECVTLEGFTITTKEDYGSGIYTNAKGSIIRDNILLNNSKGICIQNTYENLIIDNIIFSYDWSGTGILLDESYRNIITRNNISISYFSTGIRLWAGFNNVISYNIIKNSDRGIFVDYSVYNFFNNNIISNCYEWGIALCGSRYNVFTKNEISNNYIGVDIYNSYHNKIKKNNFIDNKLDAYFYNDFLFGRRNIWRGNYWNKPRLLPKPIFGKINLYLPYPYYYDFYWLNFDFRPAKEPYVINNYNLEGGYYAK